MKTKVIIDDRKFYINKDKKTVTCVIISYTNCYNLDHTLAGIMDRIHPIVKNKIIKTYPFNNCRFSATTRCSSLDEFNEEKGKRIAESKAKAKMFRHYNRYFNIIHQILKDLSLKAEKLALANEYAYKTEENHVKELDI